MISPNNEFMMIICFCSKDCGVEISESKYSVLSVDELEDGEVLAEVIKNLEFEDNEVTEVNEELELPEDDLLDHNSLDQQVQEEVKAGKSGQRAKAPDSNPGKITRPSRRKH